MHDKNGKPLAKGDKVIIEGVIGEAYEATEYCNIQVHIGRDRENGPHNVHGTVTLNVKQVEKVE